LGPSLYGIIPQRLFKLSTHLEISQKNDLWGNCGDILYFLSFLPRIKYYFLTGFTGLSGFYCLSPFPDGREKPNPPACPVEPEAIPPGQRRAPTKGGKTGTRGRGRGDVGSFVSLFIFLSPQYHLPELRGRQKGELGT
jgi:hypothetical protein